VQTTRGELLTDFLRFVTENDDDEARNVAEALLNRAISKIWLTQDWLAFESPNPYQIATTAARSDYALPTHFGRIGRGGRMRNLTTGSLITELTQNELETLAPAAYGTAITPATGPPGRYELAGLAGVHTQPIGGGWDLEVLSDAAADTDVVVSLEGEDPDGIEQRVAVTLTGTAPVSVNEWRWVDAFGKSFIPSTVPGTTAGTIEHTTSRGSVKLRRVEVPATVLQTLAPIEAAKQHQTLRFYPVPDAQYIIGVPIYRRPVPLIYDGDALPTHWREAVFEEMQIQWRVNTGELALDQATGMIRPALLDLRTHDNLHRKRPHRRPFGG
jgi:hypothetical protein